MIGLNDIWKAFHHHQVLKGINLEARKDEGVVVLGPSGSGKSTLLRCINHLERADRGSIRIGDLEVANQVAFMDDGVVVKLGTPRQVFEQVRQDSTRAFLQRVRPASFGETKGTAS